MVIRRFAAVAALVVLVVVGGCAKKQTAAPVDPGVQLFEAQKYDEAKVHYEGVLAENPGDETAAIYLARIALNQNDHNGAIEWMEKALVIAPDSSNVHYWAAMAYVVKVQKEQAIAVIDKVKTHMNKAVELNPANVDARLLVAGFLMNAPPMVGGSMEKAKEQADMIVKYDAYRGNMFKAQIHAKEKDFEAAEADVAAAAKTDPTSARPYYELGMIFQAYKEYDKAVEALEKALTTDPDFASALYQIGRTGVLSGTNLDRAAECLRMYLEREPEEGAPTWANAHWRLGLLYEKKGDPEAARAEYEAALKLNPEDENAQKALEALDSGE